MRRTDARPVPVSPRGPRSGHPRPGNRPDRGRSRPPGQGREGTTDQRAVGRRNAREPGRARMAARRPSSRPRGGRSSRRQPRGVPFLADSIENGAAFVTRLVEPQQFTALLADTRSLIAGWENPDSHACGGSCPSCLRDWSNTPFHPILDWRLAADLFEILLDKRLSHDRWSAIREAAIRGVCEDFGWEIIEQGPRPVLDCRDGTRVCVVHPLEDIDAVLADGIDTPHGKALPFDVFNFDRRPGEVYRRR